MNIIKRIWNRVTADPSAPAGGMALQSQRNSEPIVAGKPVVAESKDSFVTKYSQQPYFIFANVRPPGLLTFHPRPVVTRELMQLVFDRAGGNSNGMLSKSKKQRGAELQLREQEITKKLNEITFFSSGRIRRGFEDEAAARILKGEAPGYVPGNAEVVNSIVSQRRGLHSAQKMLAPDIHELVSECVEKMKSAARALTEEQDGRERAEHQKFLGDRPFVPSQQLIALAFVALAGCETPLRNFKLTGLLSCPDFDDLFSLWWPKPVEAPKPLPPRKEVPLRDVDKEMVESMRAAREKAVVEKNAAIEKIRAQAEVSRQSAQDARAMKQAEDEMRKMAAVQKLQATQQAQDKATK